MIFSFVLYFRDIHISGKYEQLFIKHAIFSLQRYPMQKNPFKVELIPNFECNILLIEKALLYSLGYIISILL